MKILVTGGAGFIGTNLCISLLADGHHVVVVDDLSTGREKNVREIARRHIVFGAIGSEFEFFNADIAEVSLPHLLQSNPEATDFDLIYHLACPASPPKYMAQRRKTIRTALLGTQAVLDFSTRQGKCPVVIASTSEVYGDPMVHPQTEDYFGNVDIVGPRSCYDEGKRVAEAYCAAHMAEVLEADIRIARIFNTYGPFMDPNDGRVVSNFITAGICGTELPIYGGLQTRSFCYVDDMVRGLRILGEHEEKPRHFVYNIGNPVEITIFDLFDYINALFDNKLKFKIEEESPGDPHRRCPEISHIKRMGWTPLVPLSEGIVKTLDYFKKELNFNAELP